MIKLLFKFSVSVPSSHLALLASFWGIQDSDPGPPSEPPPHPKLAFLPRAFTLTETHTGDPGTFVHHFTQISYSSITEV